MTVNPRVYTLLLALGIGTAAAACGSASNSPTGPTASGGATIQGTVVTGVGTSSAGTGSIRALSAGAGIRVTISGTSLSTITDGSGKFVLTGVPSGQVELHFEGSGIDARLQISGLTAGQTLTITVSVTGGHAVLMPDQDNEVELKGAIQFIDLGAGTLTVAGRKVVTTTATRIQGGDDLLLTLKDLKVQDIVEVKGTAQMDGSVLAANIKLEENEQEVEFKGSIQSINLGAGTLVVAGRTVVTDSHTQIEGQHDVLITLKDLKMGDFVEVEGTARTDGKVLAKKIKLEEEDH